MLSHRLLQFQRRDPDSNQTHAKHTPPTT
jgi:hypothetical protein